MTPETSGSSLGAEPAGPGVHVLLAGQSPALAAASAGLSRAGYAVRTEHDSAGARAALDETPFDMLIADWPLPGGGGESLFQAVRAGRQPDLHVIALAATGEPGPVKALLAGADDCLTAEFAEAELLARTRSGLRSTQLHATEARLRAVIANVPGAIYRCANEQDWTMELISDEIERISGYPASDFIHSKIRSYASVIHPDDREQVERAVVQATQRGRVFALEYRIVRADGSLAWVLERGQQVPDRSGCRWLDGVIFDITERKQAEVDLRRSLLRLAVGEDRERIARDLHDGVIQSLFSVGVTLQVLQETAGCPEEIRMSLAASVDRINAVIDDVRSYVRGLRPSWLADRQLHEALGHLAREFQESSGIVTPVEVEEPLAAQLSAQAAEIVQIAREALSNVRRHAGATTCRISLRRADGHTLLEIDDDGRGFDVSTARQAGHGLHNLAERSHGLGGQLAVRSDGTGTTVRVTLPLP